MECFHSIACLTLCRFELSRALSSFEISLSISKQVFCWINYLLSLNTNITINFFSYLQDFNFLERAIKPDSTFNNIQYHWSNDPFPSLQEKNGDFPIKTKTRASSTLFITESIPYCVSISCSRTRRKSQDLSLASQPCLEIP